MKLLTTLRRILQAKQRATRERSRFLFRRDEAQSLVEFALVVPVLLIVLTGIFSFGIILNQYQVLTNSVSAGARAFALSAGGAANSTSTAANEDPCAYAATVIQGSAPNLVASSINYTITYTPLSGSPTQYTGTGTTAPSCADLTMNFDDAVTVRATYPATPVVWGWSRSLTMSAQAEELVQ
ncbi:MAG: TadE/TadG family type IV pilus assembly protein [Acidobacteriaceae bacterium]